MRMRWSGGLTVLFFSTIAVIGQAMAAPAELRKTAITDAGSADADFPFVGEYAGTIATADPQATTSRAGLQVVALGDGQFSAMYYRGGLPGSGWDQRERRSLIGLRDGQAVLLVGQGIEVQIEGLYAHLRRPDGTSWGRLKKVIRRSATLGMPAPPESIVLFDGNGTASFKDAKVTEDGLLQVGTELIPKFRDFTLHLEFRTPYMPFARGQSRGNSGIYIHSRYEVQILDSFGNTGEFNECAALYRYQPPAQNMALPPLAWQTYDIDFRSARFDDQGNKIQNARITVRHNNVVVHDRFEIERKTGAGKPEGAELLPIKFQDHGDPVHFRNVWLIEHPTSTPSTDLPVWHQQPYFCW